MSRASYIWVVTDGGPAPIAAFTVKHELARWLSRTLRDRSAMTITRLRDADPSIAPVAIDQMTLNAIPTGDEEGDMPEPGTAPAGAAREFADHAATWPEGGTDA